MKRKCHIFFCLRRPLQRPPLASRGRAALARQLRCARGLALLASSIIFGEIYRFRYRIEVIYGTKTSTINSTCALLLLIAALLKSLRHLHFVSVSRIYFCFVVFSFLFSGLACVVVFSYPVRRQFTCFTHEFVIIFLFLVLFLCATVCDHR